MQINISCIKRKDSLSDLWILMKDSDYYDANNLDDYAAVIDNIKSMDFTQNDLIRYCKFVNSYYCNVFEDESTSLKMKPVTSQIQELSAFIFKKDLFVETIIGSHEFNNLVSSFISNKFLIDEPFFELICNCISSAKLDKPISLNLMKINLKPFNLLLDCGLDQFNFPVRSYLYDAIFCGLKDKTDDTISLVIDLLDKLKQIEIPWSSFLILSYIADDTTFWTIYNHCKTKLGYKSPTLDIIKLIMEPGLAENEITLESILEYKRQINPKWKVEYLISQYDILDDVKKCESIKDLCTLFNLPYNFNIYKVLHRYMSPKFIQLLKGISSIKPSAREFESFLYSCSNEIEEIIFSEFMCVSVDVSGLGMFSRKKLLKLYIKNHSTLAYLYVKDSITQFNIIKSYNDDPENKPLIMPNPNKMKSISEYHNELTKIASKIKVIKINLNQETIAFFNNYNLDPKRKFNISIPKTNHDLIDIGSLLSICVGTAQYDEKVINKESNIISIFGLDDKLLYCVELGYNDHEIIQAKGFGNKDMPYEDQSIINSLIVDKLMNEFKS
jgi:hypothetical protein